MDPRDASPCDEDGFSVLDRFSSRTPSAPDDGRTSVMQDVPASVPAPAESAAAGDDGLAPAEPAVRAAAVYDRLDRLLDALEHRVANIELSQPMVIRPPPRRVSFSASYAGSVSNADEEPIKPDEAPQTIAEVRQCGWEQFVNRFSADEPRYAVDVLVGGLHLAKDVNDECDQRRNHRFLPMALLPPLSIRPVHLLDKDETWICRVRIQSEALLGVFSKVMGYDCGSRPHTFVRPFQHLIHCHDRFKDELRRIEGRGRARRGRCSGPGGQKRKQECSGGFALLHQLRRGMSAPQRSPPAGYHCHWLARRHEGALR